MTATILRNIVETLDEFEIFNRSTGRLPCLIVDGHGSRFELPFVDYVNGNVNGKEWVVCIGVPYGTSYWQVGDSSEQNGSYKIALVKAKEYIMNQRKDMCISPTTIDTTDIIPCTNKVWKESFAKIDTNKKALCDRGWYPWNKMFLLHRDIRAQMTDKEKTDEIQNESIIIPFHAKEGYKKRSNYSNIQ